eukprot:gene10891-biopygen10957
MNLNEMPQISAVDDVLDQAIVFEFPFKFVTPGQGGSIPWLPFYRATDTNMKDLYCGRETSSMIKNATGACEKFPSHVPCAFVTIPRGEIVQIFSLTGNGTFKTGATLRLKIGDEHTWHAVAALRRDMIKKWFDVDEAVFLPPRTITVFVPRYTTIYDTSGAGEGTCSLSCTTGDTQLHVGDRTGLSATLRSFGTHTVCHADDSYHSLVFECEGIMAVVNELITNSGSRRSNNTSEQQYK